MQDYTSQTRNPFQKKKLFLSFQMSMILSCLQGFKKYWKLNIALKEIYLLHIMCGYQCDKAVNKNDTREVIWYHFTEWNDIISLHGF